MKKIKDRKKLLVTYIYANLNSSPHCVPHSVVLIVHLCTCYCNVTQCSTYCTFVYCTCYCIIHSVVLLVHLCTCYCNITSAAPYVRCVVRNRWCFLFCESHAHRWTDMQATSNIVDQAERKTGRQSGRLTFPSNSHYSCI